MKSDIASIEYFVEDALRSSLDFVVTHADIGLEFLHAAQIEGWHHIVIESSNEFRLSGLFDPPDVKGLVNRVFLRQFTNALTRLRAIPVVVAGKE